MKHDKLWYMKACKDAMEQLQKLSPDEPIAFLRLKRKAQKYLKKARELEAQERVEMVKGELAPGKQW